LYGSLGGAVDATADVGFFAGDRTEVDDAEQGRNGLEGGRKRKKGERQDVLAGVALLEVCGGEGA
jgi:hypothetical protein